MGTDAEPVEEDFAGFVTGCGAGLSRVAYLLTGDHHLAEDLLQSALAKTYRHWRKIRFGNPEAYVRRAMYHEQVTRWRRRRIMEQLRPVPEAGGDDIADGVAMRLTMAGILDHLTARQRAVVVLRYYEDLSERETAATLGCGLGTVKRHHHAAMARLRAVAPHLLGPERSGSRLVDGTHPVDGTHLVDGTRLVDGTHEVIA